VTAYLGERLTLNLFKPIFQDVIFRHQVIDWIDYLSVDACSDGSTNALVLAPVVLKKSII
jgi:hypothetical protein